MQPYKGYFVEGSVMMVHPVSPDYFVGGSVLMPGSLWFYRGNHALSTSAVHRRHKRTGGMVRPGSCPDRGGRMPASATELNGEVSLTLVSQVRRLFGNRGPRAGDQ